MIYRILREFQVLVIRIEYQKSPGFDRAWLRSKLVEAITSAHGHRKFHKENVRHGARRWKLETKHKRGSIGHILEDESRVDSPACTWQSKEAINHEDNASPPLSELRSLGWRGFLGRDERRERRREKIRRTSRGGIREATSRRPAQKVNRLPGLLVLLTNFSIHRRLPASSTAFPSRPPLPFRAPPRPPFLQLISSRPRRSGTPMFGELLIPTARDSPPAPSSSCPAESARSVLFLLLLHPWRPLLRSPPVVPSTPDPRCARGTLSSEPPRISFSHTAQHVLVPPARFSQDAFCAEDEQAKDRRELKSA